MELRDDERRALAESDRCKACGHLDCLHSGRGCWVTPCLCEGLDYPRVPSTEEIARMWPLTLRGNEAYRPVYEAARERVNADARKAEHAT